MNVIAGLKFELTTIPQSRALTITTRGHSTKDLRKRLLLLQRNFDFQDLFGCVLRCINHCRLFNAKSCFYKYIIYRVERENCRPRKDAMIPFPFYENRFSFFVADHLLVGQLCTNPKSDRSLLSCLKVTQCSTSEIGDAPLYNPCSLPIQVMTTGQLPAPSKCKSGLPRIIGTCPGRWKQSFR